VPLIILQGTAVFLPVVLRRKTGDPLKHLTEGLHIVIAHIIHEIGNAVRFSFQRFLGRFYLYPLQVFQRRILGSMFETANKIPLAHIDLLRYFFY